jgi:hypothetical protein
MFELRGDPYIRDMLDEIAPTTSVSREAQLDKDRLEQLREALNGAFNSLRRDECGTWRLLGSRGHIYRDGDGWLLFVACRSGLHWTYTKRRLALCRLTQDGEDEGCLYLDRLPSTAEAEEIRHVLRIRQTKPPTQGGFQPGIRPVFSL